MSNANKQERKEAGKQEEGSLEGTFVSVMLLGGFLILTWVAIYILFVSRA